MNTELSEKIVTQIDEVAGLLYQEKITEGYNALSTLIKNIIILTTNYEENKQQELAEVLKPALIAMEEKDYTLLADILVYEIAPLLKG